MQFKKLNFVGLLFIMIFMTTNSNAIEKSPSSTEFDSMFLKLKTASTNSPLSCAKFEDQPGCKAMFDQFCTQFNKNKKAMSFGPKDSPYEFNQKAKPNGFTPEYFEYQTAKLAAIKNNKLPDDFIKNLDPSYSSTLEKYLGQKKQIDMNADEAAQSSLLVDQLSSMFNNALSKTTRQRVEVKFPKYYNSYNPKEEEFIEVQKISDTLTASINQGIWKDYPRTVKAKSDFVETQKAFIDYVKNSNEFSDADKSRITKSLAEIKLLMPGDQSSSSAKSCNFYEENAYYEQMDHTIRICGGYLATRNTFYSTLAHEMGHSLGISRTQSEALKSSELGKSTKSLVDSVCNSNPKGGCPSNFKDYDQHFNDRVEEFSKNKIPFESFRDCLVTKNNLSPLGKDYLKSVNNSAHHMVANWMDNLAQDETLSDLVSDQLYAKPNPNYLNPCYKNVYPEKINSSDPNELISLKAIFSAQYACADPKLSREDRMTSAIEKTKSMLEKSLVVEMRFGGRTSNYRNLQSDYTENVEEKFADSFSKRVLEKMVAEKFPENTDASIAQRRDFYFANEGSYCNVDDGEKNYFPEKMAEKQFSTEPHPLNTERQFDFLTSGMANVLGCKIDFDQKECEIKP